MAASTLQTWDLALYQGINTHLTHPFLDPVMSTLSAHGFWLGLYLLALATLLLRRHWRGVRLALGIALSIGVTDATATYWLKPHFKRVRPCHWVEGARRIHGICGSTYGMPSNHAANGAVAATVLATLGPPWAWGAAAATAVVGFTRVYLGVHYPGDILAGWLWGLGVGLGLLQGLRLARRLVRRGVNKPSNPTQ